MIFTPYGKYINLSASHDLYSKHLEKQIAMAYSKTRILISGLLSVNTIPLFRTKEDMTIFPPIYGYKSFPYVLSESERDEQYKEFEEFNECSKHVVAEAHRIANWEV